MILSLSKFFGQSDDGLNTWPKHVVAYYILLPTVIFRKVLGSIPGGVIGIFHCHNTSDRTMALGSTQPLKEMSKNSPFTGLQWPRGFQEVRVPRFHENGTK